MRACLRVNALVSFSKSRTPEIPADSAAMRSAAAALQSEEQTWMVRTNDRAIVRGVWAPAWHAEDLEAQNQDWHIEGLMAAPK
jgi:hypothetical protein